MLAHRFLPYGLALLSCLLLLPALWAGFQLDDWFQRYRLLGHAGPAIDLFVFYTGDPDSNRALIESGSLAWWASETLRHANFRYLSTMTMQLDYLLWPNSPFMMHLHSLAWLAALVIAVSRLYRYTMAPMCLAGLAALLYAIDDAHALPTAYLANRNALIATFFGVLSILFQMRKSNSASAAFFALALCAAEIGLGTLAYLGAYFFFLDKASLLQRIRNVAPQALVLLCWAAVYSLGGFGSSGSGFYIDPLRHPMEFFGVMLERSTALLMGQWTFIPAELASNEYGFGVPLWLTLPVLLLLTLFVAPTLRQSIHARYWLCGSLLALLPVVATGPGNRLLFFVGLGAMALLALCIGRAFAPTAGPEAKPLRRIASKAIASALLIVHLVFAPILGYLTLDSQQRSSGNMYKALSSIPGDQALASQDLILVNPPEYTYLVSAIAPFKYLQGETIARRTRALATGSAAMTIKRLDSRTLELTLSQGLFPTAFSRYQRDSNERFVVGETIAVGGMSVSIESLNSAGDPQRIRYRFDEPLEKADIRWLQYRSGQYELWSPPAIGEIVSLQGEQGIFQ